MTQSPNITSHPKIERLPAGGLPGWCCEERNCPECLRIYREGLALRRQERAARKLRQSSPDGLKTTAQAAAKLGCSVKTLDGYVRAGVLKYVDIGHGKRRQRRMFTDADIAEFIISQTRKVTPCPSTVGHARPTGTLISSGEVIDFTRPRKTPTSVKPKK
jgi:hypothetical protein